MYDYAVINKTSTQVDGGAGYAIYNTGYANIGFVLFYLLY